LPRNGTQTLAQQLGAEDFMRTIPERTEVPWAGATSTANVQDVLDARCVSCHSGGDNDPFKGRTYHVDVTTMDGEMLAYDIPYLNLSSTPIEVYYENDVNSYPLSYVTLLYPSAMMSDSVATGDVPPQWVIPGAARESPLIRAVNIDTADGAEWAWMEQVHAMGELDGMTREERLMLIRMVDLGGQYWSRRNVEGSAAWGATGF
jgi:hypothetical protein